MEKTPDVESRDRHTEIAGSTPARAKCRVCECELQWRDCHRCDGGGIIEDDDPINGPEDMMCPDCLGRGEQEICPNCYEDD